MLRAVYVEQCQKNKNKSQTFVDLLLKNKRKETNYRVATKTVGAEIAIHIITCL